MKAKHWTIGVGLAAAVSLFGLIQANASPFSMFVLSDDLGNRVNGSAPEVPASGGASSGDDSGSSGGGDNNGHGNNEDGVDSSNPGSGTGGPNGAADESCPTPESCVDDEMSGGNTDGNAEGGEKIDVGDGAASDSKGKDADKGNKGGNAKGGEEVDLGEGAASDSKGEGADSGSSAEGGEEVDLGEGAASDSKAK